MLIIIIIVIIIIIIIVIINNNWFLYSAFPVWDTTQSALQCIITPGHWIQFQSCTHSAPSQLPGEHSGQVPLQGHKWCPNSTNRQIVFTSYRVPIYTPGWRAAMWIKCPCWRTKGPCRHRQESNPQPFDPESRVQSNMPRTSTTHISEDL